MSPQRRTALVSVAAACALLALKLTAGVASGSLGLVSEALHSGTDLVAALLTFFAVGVAIRPADAQHQYGHGKAEHLAALFEASVLAVVSVGVAGLAVARLAGWIEIDVDATWWAFVVIVVVLLIDVSRTLTSLRTGRRFHSAALLSNALHFASDLAGSLAVLIGLIGVRAGWPEADSVAALFVAALVLAAALAADAAEHRRADGPRPGRRRGGGAAGDRRDRAEGDAPAVAHALGRRASLRRRRDRCLARGGSGAGARGRRRGRGGGRARASRDRRRRPRRAGRGGRGHARARARRGDARAAVREIHNIAVLHVDGRTEVSLHLKLPADLSLEEAHAIASDVEHAIEEALPDVDTVQTHLEPLAEEAEGRRAAEADVARDVEAVTRIVARAHRRPTARASLPPDARRAGRVPHARRRRVGRRSSEAHRRASEVEEEIRAALPAISEIIVHTEPQAERRGQA